MKDIYMKFTIVSIYEYTPQKSNEDLLYIEAWILKLMVSKKELLPQKEHSMAEI